MRINTNISSMITQHHLNKTNTSLENVMERLSSGKRINSAKDDAAGLAISTRMEAAVRGKDVATRNALDGVSMLQTGESALGTVSNILQRMRELAVQAANGTNGTSDLTALDTEFDALSAEIGEIASNTTFNGLNLLDGSLDADLHVSDAASDTRNVTIDQDFGALTLTGLDTAANAQTTIGDIDTALDTVATARADIGSLLNRLGFIMDNLSTGKNNLASAQSRIEDADMAVEMSQLTRDRIVSQSAIAMLSQANSSPQSVLSLLQG